MIHVDCSACGAGFRVKETFAGRRARCTKCGEVLVIPTPEDELEVQALETLEEREELVVHHLEPLDDTDEREGEHEAHDNHARHILEQRRRMHELEVAAHRATGKVLLFSTLAALIGVLLWLGVAVVAGREYAFLCVVIGAGVGTASMLAGGLGLAHATHAAVLSVLALIGGRLLAVRQLESEPLRLAGEQAATEYDRWLEEGKRWALIPVDPGREEIAAFVAAGGHAASDDPAAVTETELIAFREGVQPVLEEFSARHPPRRQTWVEQQTTKLSGWRRHSVPGIAFESTGVEYLLFGGFGVAAAYVLVLIPFRKRREG